MYDFWVRVGVNETARNQVFVDFSSEPWPSKKAMPGHGGSPGL